MIKIIIINMQVMVMMMMMTAFTMSTATGMRDTFSTSVSAVTVLDAIFARTSTIIK